MAIGVVIICDRCGAQEVAKERDAEWYKHHDARLRWQHLCKKCLEEYRQLEDAIEAFRQTEEDKFYSAK